MGKSLPFSRAKAKMAQIRAVMAMPVGNAKEMNARDTALAEVGEYKSRGHGRGTPSKRYGNPCNFKPPHQGPRECARRARQNARDAANRERRATPWQATTTQHVIAA